MVTSREELLRDALRDADIRILLMVLFHFTGDHSWLEAPYLPVRDVRLIADPDAGLDERTREMIRQSAFDILSAESAVPLVARPSEQLLLVMMSVCLGEQVAPEYAPMMLNEMGFAPDIVPDLGSLGDPTAPFTVAIIGSGISGIVAAIRLKQAGIPFQVFEKNDDIGGTWHENTYPDCGVDTPNHFYSYSFAPNTEWNHYFSLREEIHQYLSACVDRFGIRDSIQFNTVVTATHWSDQTNEWTLHCDAVDGARSTYRSKAILAAVGQLNRPNVPLIKGGDEFEGPVFHSACWRHDVDLRGKSVGVVGAGASAMQFVPNIALEAETLTIFQRSTQWARPIGEYRDAISDGVKWLLKNVPFYGAWLRFTLEWRYGDGLHRHLFKDPTWPYPERSLNRANERHRVELTEYMTQQLGGDRELIDKSLPKYPPYAKRMLIDNGWYRTLLRPNVELVTEPVSSIDKTGLVTADRHHHDLDVLILATGFQATNLLGHIEVLGRGGAVLAERWGADDARAYLGMAVPGFPNFFVLYGPNTNLAHGGSIIFHAECQVRYLIDLFEQMLSTGVLSVEVREDVHDRYNDEVSAAHEAMVWTHEGVAPWYRNSAGRVVSNSPWRLVDYWHMTRAADIDDYIIDSGLAATDDSPPSRAILHDAAAGADGPR